MRKYCIIFLLSLAPAAFCGASEPKYNSKDLYSSTSPIMFDQLNGWRLDASKNRCAILRTSDGGRHWSNVSPPALPKFIKRMIIAEGGSGDTFASLSALDQKRAWVAMTDVKTVLVDYTADGGRHWSAHSAPASIAFSAYVSFVDEKHGFLLEVSDPAAGSERRLLYGTDDGAKRWYVLAPPGGPSNYPTGITFRTPLDGWSAGGYTAGDSVPFYCTHDGGKTWRHQKLPIPREFIGGIVDTQPPVFMGADKKRGYLPAHLEYNNTDPGREADVNYETNDGGLTWHLPASGVKIQRVDEH